VWALSDEHDTPTLYLDGTTQNPTWRQFTPYGESRGPSVAAPDNHGFLDKPMDTATGLTLIGVRQYDPSTGRFITDDPVLEKTDPTQLNGYGYAGNNPVTRADPTGERTDYFDSVYTTAFASIAIAWWVGWPSKLPSVHRDLYNRASAAGVGKDRVHSAYYNRHTGERRISSQNRALGQCAEWGCNNGYPNDRDWLWTKAVTKKEKYSLGEVYTNPEGVSLYEKAICAERCQVNTDPSQFEAGTSAEPNGRWGITKTSAFTRTGTSFIERTARANQLGKTLSKANGFLEGIGRTPAVKALGVVGVVATAAIDVYDIAKAPPAERKRVAAEKVGELAGGVAGAAAGAAVAGPVGAVVGGYLGSVGGKLLGREVAHLFHW
jgi:RHS repeat-associated protein